MIGKIVCLFTFCFINNIIYGLHSHNPELSKENVNDALYNSHDSQHPVHGPHNHESILGSHITAEEFDHLSPEESKRRLKLLALKMDKNNDEYVDKKELTAWVLTSYKMLTQEEALDQLEDEDSDDDGKVTWQEHAAETYGIYNDDIHDSEERKSSDEYKMLQNDDELFKAADVNKDGVLDKSEFPAFSHPEEFSHMHQILFDHAMEKRDKNRDGYLSLEEFVADHYGSQPDPAAKHYISEKDRFLNDYDKDKDNKLNKEEVLIWLIPNSYEMAETEANHLIESSDENKDEKLSIDEIVNHHEIFVGSEATDFGEHLHNTHKFSDEL